MEQTNFKETVIENFDPLPEVISIDVSFTSIVPILRHIESLFSQPLNIAALIKPQLDRKSTRLNSSHVSISYAVFCLKKINLSLSSMYIQGQFSELPYHRTFH